MKQASEPHTDPD